MFSFIDFSLENERLMFQNAFCKVFNFSCHGRRALAHTQSVLRALAHTQSVFNPFTATGYFDIPPSRWPTFLVTLFPILKEGMGISLLDEFEVQYHVIKSNEFQTYDGAKVKVFARFESGSARRRHCLCSRPAPTPLVEIFTGPSTTTGTGSNDGEGDDFFFLPSRVFQVYDCYFTNVLTQRSCLGFLLTADSQCFTRNDARTFLPTIPRRRLWPGERSL